MVATKLETASDETLLKKGNTISGLLFEQHLFPVFYLPESTPAGEKAITKAPE